MYVMRKKVDRLCGLVARGPGYRPRGPGFDFRNYQSFWEVVDLERGLLSLVSTLEELLGRESSGSGLESREYDHRNPSHWPRVGTKFADKRRSLGRYSSLADSGHGVCFILLVSSEIQRPTRRKCAQTTSYKKSKGHDTAGFPHMFLNLNSNTCRYILNGSDDGL
jgi:hypothetical protein